MNHDSPIPRDEFSVRLRELTDNPGAVRSSSRVDVIDFYGRNETWNIDTVCVEGSATVFLQKQTAEGSFRLMLPPKVTDAMNRQGGSITRANRKRGARQAVATRIARGDTLGNPDALKKARSSKR